MNTTEGSEDQSFSWAKTGQGLTLRGFGGVERSERSCWARPPIAQGKKPALGTPPGFFGAASSAISSGGSFGHPGQPLGHVQRCSTLVNINFKTRANHPVHALRSEPARSAHLAHQ